MLISIRPRVFVPEANYMTQLVHHNAKFVTVFADGYGLGAPSAATHIGTTPMNQQPCTCVETQKAVVVNKWLTNQWKKGYNEKNIKTSSLFCFMWGGLSSTHPGVTFIHLYASAKSDAGSWLQRPTSMWYERFSVGVCKTGIHIMALWARQPLSNYCEPTQALLRHALNFAQDRWGPAEYAAESSFPTANHRCLWVMSSLLLYRPVNRLKMAINSRLLKVQFCEFQPILVRPFVFNDTNQFKRSIVKWYLVCVRLNLCEVGVFPGNISNISATVLISSQKLKLIGCFGLCFQEHQMF